MERFQWWLWLALAVGWLVLLGLALLRWRADQPVGLIEWLLPAVLLLVAVVNFGLAEHGRRAGRRQRRAARRYVEESPGSS